MKTFRYFLFFSMFGLLALAKVPLVQAEVFTNCASQSSIPELECQALVDLYDSTNGAEWTNKTGWLNDDDLCLYYGVTCLDGHVSEIDLGSNNLNGPIPSSIGSLTSLTGLSLYGNQIVGTIPVSIGLLINLNVLHLSYNELTGPIPDTVGNLANLTSLNIGYNHLTGNIPETIGSLSNLIRLKIYHNQLTGNIPETLYSLTNLISLVLFGNQLTGTISESIGSLTMLAELMLGNNQLTGPIPNNIGLLTNLGSPDPAANYKGLSLHDNQLCGKIPKSIMDLANLPDATGLNLTNNFLYTDDNDLDTFLVIKGGDWKSSQDPWEQLCPTGFSWGMFLPAIITRQQ